MRIVYQLALSAAIILSLGLLIMRSTPATLIGFGGWLLGAFDGAFVLRNRR